MCPPRSHPRTSRFGARGFFEIWMRELKYRSYVASCSPSVAISGSRIQAETTPLPLAMDNLFGFSDAEYQTLEATLSVGAETGSEKLAAVSGSQPTLCTPTGRATASVAIHAGAKRCQTPPASTNKKRQVARLCGSGHLTPVAIRGAQTACCIFVQGLRPEGEPAPSQTRAKRCARVTPLKLCLCGLNIN